MKANRQGEGIRPSILLACLCLIGISIGTLMVFGGPEGSAGITGLKSDKGDSAGLLPRIEWPEGERQVYRVYYESRDRVRPMADDGVQGAAAEPMESNIVLEAMVGLTGEGVGTTAGSTRAKFEILSCLKASWEIDGAQVWPDSVACSAMLVGARLGVEFSERSVPIALLDPPDASSAVQSILQTLLLKMQATLPREPVAEGESYVIDEETLQGVAENRYTIYAKNGTRIDRSTEAYRDVRAARGLTRPTKVEAQGHASFEIGKTGLLRRVESDEQLSVATEMGVSVLDSTTSFVSTWERSEIVGLPTPLAKWSSRGATSVLENEAIRLQLLDQRIAGLDFDTLTSTLLDPNFRSGGPGEAKFLWRASGLLTKHPSLARELLPLAKGEAGSAVQRASALDLLTSVGHDEAQAVLRAALGDPEALLSGNVEDRHLYQRLGFLKRPNAETAQMVARHYESLSRTGDLAAEITSAYSLGAIVAKLSGGDDQARSLAYTYNEMLAGDLRNSDSPDVLAHRVAALGNTRREENVVRFSQLAGHESGQVRQTVATALGKVESEDPPNALLDLVGDHDRIVARNAIRAAAPHESIFKEVEAASIQGTLSQLNVRPVLDLVKRGQLSHPEETRRVLDALIKQGITDDRDRELAYLLRGR